MAGLNIQVTEVPDSQWQRVREIRLASLLDSPEAYGASHEAESELTHEQWLERFARVRFFIAAVADVDAAIMSVEELEGAFGAKIWLGGCWVAPEYRGKGLMRAMLGYIDSVASKRSWQRQGLGVWHDNYPAIAAYEKLGFTKMGEIQESTRKPGMFYQQMIRDTPDFKLCRLQ